MPDDKEKYIELIRRLIPISELPRNVQNELIITIKILKIRKKGEIFKQGDRDEYSYYLLEGEIELHANNQLQNVIKENTDAARYAMAQLQPRQFTAKAKSASVVIQILRDKLDKVLVMQEQQQVEEELVADIEIADMDDEGDDVDWMTKMLQSDLFSCMPTANMHQLFAVLEPVEYKAGDNVIKQGSSGEHYYIIQEGRCQVSRKPPSGDKDIKLAILNAGDSFGEEALITDTTRNASVSMITDGVLMQLSKDNFVDLIKKPTLHSVSYDEALIMIEDGTGVWLDVRFKNEHEKSAILNSLNIPLNILRMQVEKLERDKKYIVYCDTGGRSTTVAFLMTERGFDVCYLDGGLVNNHEAADSSDVTSLPAVEPKLEPAAKPEPAPEPVPEPKLEPKPQLPTSPKQMDDDPISNVDEITNEDLDPEVKASVLEAELARTDMKLEDVELAKKQAENLSLKEMQEKVEARLQEERAKIKVAQKEAEEEAARLRKLEEEKIRKIMLDAEKRMQEERKKLEEVYARNAEEMEKLQRQKQEAEEQVKLERERLEKETEEASQKLAEASRIKKEVEASKRALEKQALKHQQEQEERERIIQQKAMEKLEQERRQLAEEHAHNQEKLDAAKRERIAADAARQAAKAEAEKIIAEFKEKHSKEKMIEEAELKAERLKLEQDRLKIQETLKEIQKAKDEAELLKQSAINDAKNLEGKQSDIEITQSEVATESLKVEIKTAKEKIDEAEKQIVMAKQAQEKVEVEEKINAEDLGKKKLQEEKFRQEVEADLNLFREDQAEKEESFADVSSQLAHMKRIKAQAEAAKMAVQKADSNLLEEIERQLKI